MSNLLADYLKPEALAAEIGIHVRTLRKWDELGIGPPKTQIGRLTLYRVDSVREWLSTREKRQDRKRRAR
jgi:DNA-binding transcriptional MerR regulator